MSKELHDLAIYLNVKGVDGGHVVKDAALQLERLRAHICSMPCPANGVLNQSTRTVGECQASGICECKHGPVLSENGDGK